MTKEACSWQAKAPVFVLGSPRSGTTLLYNMLLSSGNFADYRVESDVFNRIGPAFGTLKSAANRTELVNAWLESDYFRRSGLETQDIHSTLLSSEWRNSGDFLRIVMESIARKQGVERWADKTPSHLLYIPQIKESIPNALIIHIIRDGRDVAMSLNRMGAGNACPWDKKHRLLVCALYWQWLVRKGRKYGRPLGVDYLEVRYEELVQYPRETLAKLGDFIHHDLDLERIQRNAIGAVKKPNTSFRDEAHRAVFSPIARWKELPDLELARLGGLLGEFLLELGYEASGSSSLDFTAWRLRAFYPRYRALRQHLKQTALSRFLIPKDMFLRCGALDELDSLWEALSERPVQEVRALNGVYSRRRTI